jgi:hypothetical protein
MLRLTSSLLAGAALFALGYGAAQLAPWRSVGPLVDAWLGRACEQVPKAATPGGGPRDSASVEEQPPPVVAVSSAERGVGSRIERVGGQRAEPRRRGRWTDADAARRQLTRLERRLAEKSQRLTEILSETVQADQGPSPE